MSEVDTQKFSISRINRLLRPLRNRCISLASFATEGCLSSDYAKRSSKISLNHANDPDFPPLSFLQPPMDMGSRIHFDKHHIESLEMSRKLYAVRDCFQEIVSKTGRKNIATTGTRRSVMSLAAICSVLVGENMPSEVDVNSDDVEDENLVNDIYEAVPLQYRRFALLAHAINLVLNTTIHHPTLLSILLDVTLAHGLLYESSILLRALLFVALSPMSTSARPPICHPAHSVFLLELRSRWNGGGFQDQAFCGVLVEVLHAVQSHEAWGCKAVHKFAKNIWGSDFISFMELAGGCASMASMLDNLDQRKIRRIKLQDNSYVTMRLWTRIHQWLDIACDHCITAEDSRVWSIENSDAVYVFLELSLFSDLHRDMCPVDNGDILREDLQGAVVCLATLLLSSPFVLNLQADSIVNRLREITPRSSTYAILVPKIFAKLNINLGQSKLRYLAAILCLHGLLRLEASLWACALRHIELQTSEHLLGSSNGVEKIREFRDRLIELVDDAEHRCFGVDAPSSDFRHMPAKVDASGSTAGPLEYEWQWESMLRCWVRREDGHSSAKKKRKIEHAAMLYPRFRSSHTRHIAGVAGLNTSVSTGITRTRYMHMGRPIGEGYVKQRSNTHTRDMRLPLQPSSSSFTTLLADAFSQRTVLHDDIQKKKTQARDICLSGPSHDAINLGSDDLLDLFICCSPPQN